MKIYNIYNNDPLVSESKILLNFGVGKTLTASQLDLLKGFNNFYSKSKKDLNRDIKKFKTIVVNEKSNVVLGIFSHELNDFVLSVKPSLTKSIINNDKRYQSSLYNLVIPFLFKLFCENTDSLKIVCGCQKLNSKEIDFFESLGMNQINNNGKFEISPLICSIKKTNSLTKTTGESSKLSQRIAKKNSNLLSVEGFSNSQGTYPVERTLDL